MKYLQKTLIASALALAAAGSASAMISSDLEGAVRSAAGSESNVNVFVDGSTVTLTGYVEDLYSLNAIERAADNAGADEVINNVLRTN